VDPGFVKTAARAYNKRRYNGGLMAQQRDPGAESGVTGEAIRPKLKDFCPFSYKRGAKS